MTGNRRRPLGVPVEKGTWGAVKALFKQGRQRYTERAGTHSGGPPFFIPCWFLVYSPSFGSNALSGLLSVRPLLAAGSRSS